MPTNVTKNNQLTLTLDGSDFSCQVIDLSFEYPVWETGENVEVACGPGESVNESGSRASGRISGEVFADTLDTGVTIALMDAIDADAEVPFVLDYYSDQANTVSVRFSGNVKVSGFELPFSKPGNARHSLDLEVLPNGFTRGRPA